LCCTCELWQLNNLTSFKQCFKTPLKPSYYYRICIAICDTVPIQECCKVHRFLTEDNDNSYRKLTKLCQLQTASPYKTFICLFFNVLTQLFDLNIIIFRLVPIGSYTPLHRNFPGLEASPWSHFVALLEAALPFSQPRHQLTKNKFLLANFSILGKERSSKGQDLVDTKLVRAFAFVLQPKNSQT